MKRLLAALFLLVPSLAFRGLSHPQHHRPSRPVVLTAGADRVGLTRATPPTHAPEPPPRSIVRQPSRHWSFQPIGRPAAPAILDSAWPRNPIDCFVLARLRKEGLAPSGEADRTTLMRRLSLDLRGLPPSLAEVEACLKDNRLDWYERLVDQFLASAHYGEHWGRFWLDASRYADTDGFQVDGARSVWKYRDWVIAALNQDMPFDQFLICQLAGDQLAPCPGTIGVEQRIATGFLRNATHNREAGVDPERARFDRVVDWTNTTATVFLGLTLECAQCHHHKFDPISQKEYYQFLAFFNGAEEADLALPTRAQTTAAEQAQKDIAALESARLATGALRASAQAALEAELRAQVPRWTVMVPEQVTSSSATQFRVLADGSVLAQGTPADQENYTAQFISPLTQVTGVRLELIPDAALPQSGVGRAQDGNWEVTEFRVEICPAGNPVATQAVRICRAESAGHIEDSPVTGAIDNDDYTSWTGGLTKLYPDQVRCRRVAVFQFAAPVGFSPGTRWVIHLQQQTSPTRALGRFRLALTTSPQPLEALPVDVESALAVSPLQRTQEEKAALDRYYDYRLRQRIRQLRAAVPIADTTLVLAGGTPRPTYVLQRGEFDHPGARVDPDVPAVLPSLAVRGQPTRLDLARWLAGRDNPLVARVLVNRIWQRYFGLGLVETENDFGTRGARPTHPELLDWLARVFLDRGESLKELHRLIVTSAAYRQRSTAPADLVRRDPHNHLVGRQQRLRLEAEVIRDSTLTVSGRLCPKMGGPSVFPPQPREVLEQGWNKWSWNTSTGGDRYRRTLYTFARRSAMHPALTLFDAPDASRACTRRAASVTPLQALMLLNDPAYEDLAHGLALRALAEGGGGDEERIRFLYRVCLARLPGAEEVSRVRAFLEDQRGDFQANPAAAAVVAGPVAGQTAVLELASWTAVCRVFLNLDEFITRE